MRKLFILFVTVLLVGCAVKNPPSTMKQVSLKKYMGTWYEIASLPAPFQKHCYCTKAQYQLEGDHVKVTNSCRKGSATSDWDVAHATGKVYPNSGNSRLSITFFWPFSADYYILYVSKDYQTAVVGTPNRKYLWILSRTKTISTVEFKRLLAIATSKGYDLTELHKTVQCLR